jgi:hypothetical protein
MEGVGVIDGQDYVLWVQRSLNRNFGVNLKPDGHINPDYRREIKEFQLWYVPQYRNANMMDSRLGKVDAVTQDRLIESNHTREAYLRWVQKALTKVGLMTPETGVLDMDTIKNIKAFQGSPKRTLKVDGWVGSKTETKLWRESGILPPGSEWNGNAPKPLDKPWHEGQKNKARILEIFGQRFSEDMMRSVQMPFAMIGPAYRPVYRDLVRYMLREEVWVDTAYLTPRHVQDFSKFDGARATWDRIDATAIDGHEEAMRVFNRIYDNAAYNSKEKAYAAFAAAMVAVCKGIDAGRDEINSRSQNVNGDLGNVRNVVAWWMSREEAPSAMYHAFRKNLPKPSWWDKVLSYLKPTFPTRG